MLAATEKKLFRPNAVFIPTKDGKEGRDFDRSDCTLLLVDGEYSHGEVYTEEAWKNGGSASYIQRCGDFFLPDGSEIPDGRRNSSRMCASSNCPNGTTGAMTCRP